MDLITGFPGEGEDEFEETLHALESLPWSRLHVFPYSERAGTPATRLPGSVPREERIRRTRLLAELSLSRMEALCRQAIASCAGQGTGLTEILLERPFEGAPAQYAGPCESRWWIAGYTANYIKVLMPIPEARSEAEARFWQNRLVAARPEGTLRDAAAGEVAVLARLLDAPMERP